MEKIKIENLISLYNNEKMLGLKIKHVMLYKNY
jgi:hypothetical protein